MWHVFSLANNKSASHCSDYAELRPVLCIYCESLKTREEILFWERSEDPNAGVSYGTVFSFSYVIFGESSYPLV